jgi:hypothetical protein
MAILTAVSRRVQPSVVRAAVVVTALLAAGCTPKTGPAAASVPAAPLPQTKECPLAAKAVIGLSVPELGCNAAPGLQPPGPIGIPAT